MVAKITKNNKQMGIFSGELWKLEKKLEEAQLRIREEQRKNQTILDNFIDGLLIFNSDEKLESVNSTAEVFLGVKEDKIFGNSMARLAKRPQTRELIKAINRGAKEVFRKELILSKKKLVLETTTKFVIFEKKKIATLIILHDVTRERLIEKLKSQFISVAAHQLRTPLSIIKWSLSMLIEEELGALTLRQKEILLKTNQTNERMIQLINDLLDVARIEEGRFVYQSEAVDFVELLQRLIKSFRPLAREKKINFEFDLNGIKGSMVVKADTEKLTLAISNLIENAISYTDPGGKIVLFLKKRNNQLELSIRDTGIGIPGNQHNRVFAKFFRGDNAVRMETEGTGLGLFIAKNIIEAHGGKIWFESARKKGTTFFFSLPIIG